jgi:transketolase
MTLVEREFRIKDEINNKIRDESTAENPDETGGEAKDWSRDLADFETRCLAVRRRIVRMCATRDGGHLGGSMSLVEILTYLYTQVLRTSPELQDDPDRDFLVLSKGHGAIGLYAVLAETDFLADEFLESYGDNDGPLYAHPNDTLPGIEISTGSLGHGLPVALGVALAARLRDSNRRALAVLGDGELQEGSVWEAAMYAGSKRVSNLTAIVDNNGLQITGPTDDIIRLDGLGDRWRAFGWEVREVDGHDTSGELLAALARPSQSGAPVAVIARTTKGRGVPAVEGQKRSHFATLGESQLKRTLRSLEPDIEPSTSPTSPKET